MMVSIKMVIDAIHEHVRRTKENKEQLLIVMGLELYEQLADEADKMFVKKIGRKWDSIAGVEILIKNRIPGEIFAIMKRSCLDHVDDHIDDLLEELDDGPDWIQCDLCKYPLSIELADGDDLICLWCGDVNDLEDIEKGEY